MPDKNLILFIGDDFVSLLFLNHFIHQLIEMGINPIVIKVDNGDSYDKDNLELERYGFYQKSLLQDVLVPFIENQAEDFFELKTPNQIISKYNLKIYETKNVNDRETIDFIEAIDIIGAISVRCFQIFKFQTISAIKEKGFFCNSHPGILPNYRGVYCLLRGLVNGDKKLGWTLHDIDTGIDTGQVINEIPFYNFNKNDGMINILGSTVGSLVDGWLDFIYEEVHEGSVERIGQKNKGQYYTYPTVNEFDNWYSSGCLKPLVSKEMVKFYFDLFVSPQKKLKQTAQDFKVTMINKVAQFETMIEMNQAISQPEKITKKAAA